MKTFIECIYQESYRSQLTEEERERLDYQTIDSRYYIIRDKIISELKSKKDGKDMEQRFSAYKHISKQIKEFYKIHKLKELEKYFSFEDREIIDIHIPTKRQVSIAQDYLIDGIPNKDSITHYKVERDRINLLLIAVKGLGFIVYYPSITFL